MVDDDEAVRGLAARVLRRAGHPVLEAEDAPRALELAASHQGGIALLLTDLMMPAMTGDALAARLRESNPAIVVVFMSGYSEDELAGLGIGGVGAAYLTKPFTAEVLTLVVEGALGK